MAKQDCGIEMRDFHDDEVTLGKNDQEEMHDRREAGRTRLANGLTTNGHSLPAHTVSQGSYAMRTMVQDNDCDYDIDDGAYFRRQDLQDKAGNDLPPKAVRQRVANALRNDVRLKYEAQNLKNCVRQQYPEGYHIDIPVYRLTDIKDALGKTITTCELASGDGWVLSDGRAVTKWFKDLVGELNRNEEDGSQLRRVVKLTKRFARRQSSWKSKTTSGIALTKLITESFVAKPGRDDESLHETWKALLMRLQRSTSILHPVTGSNPWLAEEGNSKVEFFKGCLSDALETLEVLDDEGGTKKKACRAWDKVFNTDYFIDRYEESEEKTRRESATSLLRPAVPASVGLTFPAKPVQPNKSQGFA